MKYKVKLESGFYSMVEFETDNFIDFDGLEDESDIMELIEKEGIKNSVYYMRDEYENFTVYREV